MWCCQRGVRTPCRASPTYRRGCRSRAACSSGTSQALRVYRVVHVPHGTNGGGVDQEEMSSAKRRLLDATIEYVAEESLGELSLRQLAAAIGTSHRMLIYHFGSKEELLVEVVREVERRERASSAHFRPDAEHSEAEQMRRRW